MITKVEAAEVLTNAVAVKYDEAFGILTIDVPDGYDDIKRVSKWVLEFRGQTFTFTGWNSDTLKAYFKRNTDVARIRK